MVASIAHNTQQNFLIGTFAKSDGFHWSRHILHQYPTHPTNLQPYILLTHTYPPSISYFVCESLSLFYQSYTTMSRRPHKTRSMLSLRDMRYLNFDTYLTILIFSPHTINSIYFQKHTSVFPQKFMAM